MAMRNVSAAVLAPRIPHVDSTTMLIARLHRQKLVVPDLMCIIRHSEPQLGLSWLGWGGLKAHPGPACGCWHVHPQHALHVYGNGSDRTVNCWSSGRQSQSQRWMGGSGSACSYTPAALRDDAQAALQLQSHGLGRTRFSHAEPRRPMSRLAVVWHALITPESCWPLLSPRAACQTVTELQESHR